MQGTSIWWIMAAVGALLIVVALWDISISPWLYERRARKFYERMNKREGYDAN